MNDIDFDELDRAVSSALGSSDQPATDTTAPSAQTDAPASPALVVPERTSTQEASRPVQAPAARRSAGRFMDVVHPSSDMRSTASAASSSVSTPAPAASDPAPKSDWPDPIDLATKQNESPVEPDVTEPTSLEQPLDSPFLPDAQVEKRPLGAPAPTSSLDDALAALNLSGDEQPQESEAAPEPVEEPETTEASALAPETLPLAESPELEVSEERLVGARETSDTDPTTTPAPVSQTAPAVAQEPTPVVQPSIQQQYTERAPAEQQTSGAIYDTESYHQPLAHPEKKRGSWVVVLWIVGLIVLGGGLGAAAYFFLLPLL